MPTRLPTLQAKPSTSSVLNVRVRPVFARGLKKAPTPLGWPPNTSKRIPPIWIGTPRTSPSPTWGTSLRIGTWVATVSSPWPRARSREGGDWHEKGAKFLILGGEHSISYAPIKTHLEKFPNLLLLHLDAHADLRESYQEFKYSHACIIRRIFDHFGPHHRLVQYGIRSGTREEYRWMEEKKTLKKSLEDLLAFLKQVPDQRPIYLTLDLDYFDPCYLPGTGTPEPGGETFHSFVSLIKVLKAKRFVGADVVELSPDLDSSGNSSIFAAKVVRELILALTFSEAYQRPR